MIVKKAAVRELRRERGHRRGRGHRGERRKFCGPGEGLVRGIEETLQIGGSDGAMRLRVLLGKNERVGEAIDGRNGRHGSKRGAIVFGGALVVAARLLKRAAT